MTTQSTLAAPSRKSKQPSSNPFANGLPDPRPVTDYAVALTSVAGHSRITITLSQPCVIRQPAWPLIDCTAGGLVYPQSVTVVSNTQFYMDYAGTLGSMTAFVQVPYQDTQVQNFQGGFVRPGGQWFRADGASLTRNAELGTRNEGSAIGRYCDRRGLGGEPGPLSIEVQFG